MYHLTGVSCFAHEPGEPQVQVSKKEKHYKLKEKKGIIEKYICTTTISKGLILRYYKNALKIRLKKAHGQPRVCQKGLQRIRYHLQDVTIRNIPLARLGHLAASWDERVAFLIPRGHSLLFSIFINNLNKETECTLSKFTEVTKRKEQLTHVGLCCHAEQPQ